MKQRMRRLVVSWGLVFLSFLILTDCSIRKMIVDQLEPVVDEMQASILSESEEQIIQGTLPFAIKLAESLHRYYPSSPYYSGKLALLYAAYTFSYIDDTPYSDFDDQADRKIRRISILYQKAFEYGLKSLATRYPRFDRQIFQAQQVDQLLQQIKPESVETLFWFNFSWALKLFYNLEEVSSIVHLETIKKIALTIERLNPNYFYGINKAVLITYYGGRTKSLGGDQAKAREYYQQSLKLNPGESLVNDFVYFRFVTVQNRDPREFETIYQKIKKFDLNKNPAFYFVNQMIQNKAKKVYLKKDFFF